MFGKIKDMLHMQGDKPDLFEENDLEFNHRLLTNGVWLEGENKFGQREKTFQLVLEHLVQKNYPLLFISDNKESALHAKLEDMVTQKRRTRDYQRITEEMTSINSLHLTDSFQKHKIVHIDLSIFTESDQKVVLERLNHQLKLLFKDMYANFKKYQKKESLRGLICIDGYDIKQFKVFANMEFFETMRDFEIGFIFGVEQGFFAKKGNPHIDNLNDIVHFTTLQVP